jgi:hypothetical protein
MTVIGLRGLETGLVHNRDIEGPETKEKEAPPNPEVRRLLVGKGKEERAYSHRYTA